MPRHHRPRLPVEWPTGGYRRVRKRRRRYRSSGSSGRFSGATIRPDLVAPPSDPVPNGDEGRAPVVGRLDEGLWNDEAWEEEPTAPVEVRPPRRSDLPVGGDGRRRVRKRRRGRPVKKKTAPTFEARGGRAEKRDRNWAFRRRRRRRRLVVAGLVLFGLAGLGAITVDAYVQVGHVLDHLRDAADGLKSARNALLQGKSPGETVFSQAAEAIDAADTVMEGARPDVPVIGALPLIGMPVKATKNLLEASHHELSAALTAKDLLEGILGHRLRVSGPAESGNTKAKSPRSIEEIRAKERKKSKEKDQGSDEPREPKGDPDALIFDGTINLEKLTSLQPQVEKLVSDLRAAAAMTSSIPSVPFIEKARRLREDLEYEVNESANLAVRGLSGLKLLPAVLGGGEKRTYLLLFSDEGVQRGTGGEYFAYLQFTIDHGQMTLDESGPIIEIDPTFRNVHVPVPKSNWYLHTYPASVRIGNLNWDPDFRSTAALARLIYQKKSDTETLVDGVIQIDISGVAGLLAGTGPIRVPSWPTPLTSGNLVKVSTLDSYREFEGGQEEIGDVRKQFHQQLVDATWRRLRSPTDLVRTVYQLSKALAERHLQIWSSHPKEQAFFERQRWAGAIPDQRGDYLYVVDQNRGIDRLDTFMFERTNYDVAIREDGSLDVTATVRQTNYPPVDLPKVLRGTGTLKTFLNVYAPENAELRSITTVIRGRRADRPLQVHTHHHRKVFTTSLGVPLLETGQAIFRYTIPNAIFEVDGRKTYRLNLQRQPRLNTQSVAVRVTYPLGWDVRDPDPAWHVSGHTATLSKRVPEDFSIDLTF